MTSKFGIMVHIRSVLFKYIVALAACVVCFKSLLLLLPDSVSRQEWMPHSFTDWLIWLFNPFELSLPIVAVSIEFVFLWLILRRLTVAGIALWAGLLSIYIAIVSYPLDLWSRFDDRTAASLPDNAFVGFLEVAVVVIVFPAIIAFFVLILHAAVSRLKAAQKPI